MTVIVPARLTKRYTRMRKRGRVLSPVLDASTLRRIKVTTPYRQRGTAWALGYHTGEDHACPVGSLAVAITRGTVLYAGHGFGPGSWGEAYGNHVVIATKGGRYRYLYAHLDVISVRAGMKVRPGSIVGRTGSSGNSTGPHLHFEARRAPWRYGDDINPITLKRKASRP